MTLRPHPHAPPVPAALQPADGVADAHECGPGAATSRQPLPASRKVRVQGQQPPICDAEDQ